MSNGKSLIAIFNSVYSNKLRHIITKSDKNSCFLLKNEELVEIVTQLQQKTKQMMRWDNGFSLHRHTELRNAAQ